LSTIFLNDSLAYRGVLCVLGGEVWSRGTLVEWRAIWDAQNFSCCSGLSVLLTSHCSLVKISPRISTHSWKSWNFLRTKAATAFSASWPSQFWPSVHLSHGWIS